MAKKKENTETKLLTHDINLDEIKNELTEYVDLKMNKIVDDKIKKEIIGEIDKSNRRLIREKNKKILSKNIVIIVLLVIICGLVYLLYDNKYFDRYFNKDYKDTKEVVDKKKSSSKKDTKEEKKEKKPTLSELKDKYGYLINNIYIYENSDYLEDYYGGNLTTELKNYLSLNLVDISKLQEEDDYNLVDTDVLKEKYEELFDTNYESKTFKYNGNTVRYINKIDSYITEEKINKKSSNIKREIIDISVEDKEIRITTVEAKVVDNEISNIITGEEASNMIEDKDKLNIITYVFKNDKLVSIEK